MEQQQQQQQQQQLTVNEVLNQKFVSKLKGTIGEMHGQLAELSARMEMYRDAATEFEHLAKDLQVQLAGALAENEELKKQVDKKKDKKNK